MSHLYLQLRWAQTTSTVPGARLGAKLGDRQNGTAGKAMVTSNKVTCHTLKEEKTSWAAVTVGEHWISFWPEKAFEKQSYTGVNSFFVEAADKAWHVHLTRIVSSSDMVSQQFNKLRRCSYRKFAWFGNQMGYFLHIQAVRTSIWWFNRWTNSSQTRCKMRDTVATLPRCHVKSSKSSWLPTFRMKWMNTSSVIQLLGIILVAYTRNNDKPLYGYTDPLRIHF